MVTETRPSADELRGNQIEITKMAENLFLLAANGKLKPEDPQDPVRIAFLSKADTFFSNKFDQMFPNKKDYLIESRIEIGKGYVLAARYVVDEGDDNKRIINFSWGNRSWRLDAQLYHSVEYHRLDVVTIRHDDQAVDFQIPDKYVHKSPPSDSLPTHISVRKLVPNLDFS